MDRIGRSAQANIVAELPRFGCPARPGIRLNYGQRAKQIRGIDCVILSAWLFTQQVTSNYVDFGFLASGTTNTGIATSYASILPIMFTFGALDLVVPPVSHQHSDRTG